MPIHLIWGDDYEACNREIEEIIHTVIDPLWKSFNYSQIDGNDQKQNFRALEEVQSAPLGSGGRVVLVRRSPFCNGCSIELTNKLEQAIKFIPDKRITSCNWCRLSFIVPNLGKNILISFPFSCVFCVFRVRFLYISRVFSVLFLCVFCVFLCGSVCFCVFRMCFLSCLLACQPAYEPRSFESPTAKVEKVKPTIWGDDCSE